jgi:hypothetical protein
VPKLGLFKAQAGMDPGVILITFRNAILKDLQRVDQHDFNFVFTVCVCLGEVYE